MGRHLDQLYKDGRREPLDWLRRNYRKIPKISPSKYKHLKIVTQKTLRQIAPPNISPPGGLYMEFALEYKVKQSKNGKFPSHYKLAQSILKP